jgi:hypothetical protein
LDEERLFLTTCQPGGFEGLGVVGNGRQLDQPFRCKCEKPAHRLVVLHAARPATDVDLAEAEKPTFPALNTSAVLVQSSYSDSPAASRASSRSMKGSTRTTLPALTVKITPVSVSTTAPLFLPFATSWKKTTTRSPASK